jgi:hypothetical protein
MVLFTDIADLKAAGIPVNNTYSLDGVNTYLDSIWQELLPQFIGQDQIEAFDDLFGEGGDPTPEELKVKPYLQRVVGRLGFAQYLPFAEVQIAADGITISGDEKRKAAFERQVKQIRTTLLESGWKSLESLLAYLDSHTDEFDPYKTFKAAADVRLLPNAVEFSQYYQIGQSRVTYNALLPVMDRLQRDTLEPQLGDRWPDLLTSNEMADKRLRVFLKTWLAYRTIAEAIPMLAIEITGSGLRLHYSSHIDNVDYFTPPSEAQLNRLLAKAEAVSVSAWSDAITQLTPTDNVNESRVVNQDTSKIIIF